MRKIRWLLYGLCVFAGAAPCAERIKVGCDMNFMPFEFKRDGAYVGFDIDLWAGIAKDLQLEYDIQPMDFNGLIPALQSGGIDAALAGMTITSQREEVVDFSFPYYTAGLMILVRSGEKGIASIADLEGKVVATKLGTTSDDFIKKNVKAKGARLFPNIDGAYMELGTGGASAVIFDSPAIRYYATTTGKGRVEVVGPLYKGQSYGIAFPQGSLLRERVNRALLKMMEDGRYAILYHKWFGQDPG